jgi:hypothetical protein
MALYRQINKQIEYRRKGKNRLKERGMKKGSIKKKEQFNKTKETKRSFDF